jgi:hypothetical protein
MDKEFGPRVFLSGSLHIRGGEFGMDIAEALPKDQLSAGLSGGIFA